MKLEDIVLEGDEFQLDFVVGGVEYIQCLVVLLRIASLLERFGMGALNLALKLSHLLIFFGRLDSALPLVGHLPLHGSVGYVGFVLPVLLQSEVLDGLMRSLHQPVVPFVEIVEVGDDVRELVEILVRRHNLGLLSPVLEEFRLHLRD